MSLQPADASKGAILDTSEDQPVYLYEGRDNTYVRLSPSAHTLLRMVQSGKSFQQIAALASRQSADSSVTPADIEAAYADVRERIEAIEADSSMGRSGFWGKVQILSSERVERIADALTWTFRWPVLLVVAAIACAGMWVATTVDYAGGALSGGDFWAGYGLLLLSLLVHEFGHASACRHYGARVGDIGGTIYLVYPALYSDVSPAWGLGRWKRVVIDLSGVYFQSVVGAAYVFAYAYTDLVLFQAAFMLVGISLLFSLNPIFKFDGYWVVADALGITNLSKQPLRLVRHYWNRLRGKDADPLPWSPRIVQLLSAYSVLAVGVWTYFAYAVVPLVWSRVWSYPEVVSRLVVSYGDASVAAPSFGDVLTSTLFALTAVIIAARLGNMLRLRIRGLFNNSLRFIRRHAGASGAGGSN